MSKNLRRTIMKKSQIKTKCFKTNTVESLWSHKKQKSSSNLYKKERKKEGL